jgi:leucine dehydrogenase
VGSHLVAYLVKEGAKVFVSDIDKEKVARAVAEFKVEAVDADKIHAVECEVFAPCALGAVVNDKSIREFKCKVIAGGANNQLLESRHGDQLRELGILYAPDFVVNSGGLMNVFVELEGYSPERAFDKTRMVYDNCMRVFKKAEAEGIGTHKAADLIAEERIRVIGSLRQKHPGRYSRSFTTLREIDKR